jgi:hypothetical protein
VCPLQSLAPVPPSGNVEAEQITWTGIGFPEMPGAEY